MAAGQVGDFGARIWRREAGEVNPALRFRCEEDWENPERWALREYSMVPARRRVCQWDKSVSSAPKMCSDGARWLKEQPEETGHDMCTRGGGKSVHGLWFSGQNLAQEYADMTKGDIDKLEESDYLCLDFGPYCAVREYSMVNMNRLVCVYDNIDPSSISGCLDLAEQLNERAYQGHQCNGGERVRGPWVSQENSVNEPKETCTDASTKCVQFEKYCIWNRYVTARCQETCGFCNPKPHGCTDASTKCDQFEKYCGANSDVTAWCQKTCGVCKS